MDAAMLNEQVRALHRDCHALAQYIALIRKSVSEMRPQELRSIKLPRAVQEIGAVTKETEAAAETIMSAVEEIMALKIESDEKTKAALNDACVRILEACAFQDITGQRITKIAGVLTYLEEMLERLGKLLGEDVKDAPLSPEDRSAEKSLINGPALNGQGLCQSEIDRLVKGS